MINRDDIEAGDKCYTRDGGCLVAYDDDGLSLAIFSIDAWDSDGFLYSGKTHPLDIIRIEKAPKPVVKNITVVWSETGVYASEYTFDTVSWPHEIKLTIISGKLEKAEQVK